MDRVVSVASDFAKEMFGGNGVYLKTFLRRLPQGQDLSDPEISELAKKITAKRPEIIKIVSVDVYKYLASPDIGRVHSRNKSEVFNLDVIKNRVFLEMRMEILKMVEENISNSKKDEVKMEKHFSREQSTKLIKLIRGVREIQNQVDPKDMKEIIEEIIQEDLIDKGIFNKEDFSWALEHVNKQIQFLNDNKKQYE